MPFFRNKNISHKFWEDFKGICNVLCYYVMYFFKVVVWIEIKNIHLQLNYSNIYLPMYYIKKKKRQWIIKHKHRKNCISNLNWKKTGYKNNFIRKKKIQSSKTKGKHIKLFAYKSSLKLFFQTFFKWEKVILYNF